MTIRVKYEAVLEYDEENLPEDPREEMLGLITSEPDFGHVSVSEVEHPVDGSVIKTNWVDDGTLRAWVEKDGRTWCETYKFETKKEVMGGDT